MQGHTRGVRGNGVEPAELRSPRRVPRDGAGRRECRSTTQNERQVKDSARARGPGSASQLLLVLASTRFPRRRPRPSWGQPLRAEPLRVRSHGRWLPHWTQAWSIPVPAAVLRVSRIWSGRSAALVRDGFVALRFVLPGEGVAQTPQSVQPSRVAVSRHARTDLILAPLLGSQLPRTSLRSPRPPVGLLAGLGWTGAGRIAVVLGPGSLHLRSRRFHRLSRSAKEGLYFLECPVRLASQLVSGGRGRHRRGAPALPRGFLVEKRDGEAKGPLCRVVVHGEVVAPLHREHAEVVRRPTVAMRCGRLRGCEVSPGTGTHTRTRGGVEKSGGKE